MPSRPESSADRAIAKPCPSSPMRRESGTRTPSKWSWAVGEPFMPIFFSGAAALRPSASPGTRKAVMPAGALLAGAGHDGVEVGDAAVGDPGLGAGDHPVVAVPDRPGAQGGGVGAGGGLGEAVRAEQSAAEHRGQVLGLLLLGAVGGERVAGEGVHADAEADGEAGGGELLEDLEVDLVRLVAAAVFASRRAGRAVRTRESRVKTSRGKCPASSSSAACGAISRCGDVADERDQIPGLLRGQLRSTGCGARSGMATLSSLSGAAADARGVGGAAGSHWCQADARVSGSRKLLTSGCGAVSMPDRRHSRHRLTTAYFEISRPRAPNRPRIGPNH